MSRFRKCCNWSRKICTWIEKNSQGWSSRTSCHVWLMKLVTIKWFRTANLSSRFLVINWLINWLIVWLIDYWLIDWVIDWSIHSFIHQFFFHIFHSLINIAFCNYIINNPRNIAHMSKSIPWRNHLLSLFFRLFLRLFLFYPISFHFTLRFCYFSE